MSPAGHGTDTVRVMDGRIHPAPEAVLGRSDDTRRWAISDDAGRLWFPGLTRPEGREALRGLPPGKWQSQLVEVALPVLLSDGAGPHLLDAWGNLVLALGEHPHVEASRLALGPIGDKEQAGLVMRQGSASVWRWVARAVIDPGHRVQALDELERVGAVESLVRWLHAADAWG